MGVLGMAKSSSISSNSGLDRSTSGLGLSSRRLSRSDSSADMEGAVDGLGEMMARARARWLSVGAEPGSGSGWCGQVVR
jgi:hypothetical protein